MPHDKDRMRATCPHCGSATHMGTAYLSHTRRCERETAATRAYYRDTGHWPPKTLPDTRPKGESQLGLF